MKQQKKQEESFSPENFVADHLTEHPDFFEQHLDLLLALKIPHSCGESISLVERQLTALREKNKNLSDQLLTLINNAQDNSNVHRQLEKLTLSLFEADSLNNVFKIIHHSLQNEFQAEKISLKLFTAKKKLLKQDYFFNKKNEGIQLFEYFLKKGNATCSRLSEEQKAYLFGQDADDIKSCALIFLANDSTSGILAIGSQDEKRYPPGKGTRFLDQLGELFSKVTHVHINKTLK